MNIDEKFMKVAVGLAMAGRGQVHPNPIVGAVVVKDGKMIGEGYHAYYGGAHAETCAIDSAGEACQGATLYVTLEPCHHVGKTPSCSEAILKAGISRVVVGSEDPNPLVSGKGVAFLREHGVVVDTGICKGICNAVNAIFFHYIKTATPYVTLKYAMSLDGKTATSTGDSKWITGEAARALVQQDRMRYMAIMVGVGTVLADDPRLTCRLPNAKQPLRIVCDSHLRTPLEAFVVTTAREIPTLIATAETDSQLFKPYENLGCQVVSLPNAEGRVDLKALVTHLAKQEIDSLMIEGGGELAWSALAEGIVHHVQAYIAPLLLGGQGATPLSGKGVAEMQAAFRLRNTRMRQVGDDLLWEGDVCQTSSSSLTNDEVVNREESDF